MVMTSSPTTATNEGGILKQYSLLTESIATEPASEDRTVGGMNSKAARDAAFARQRSGVPISKTLQSVLDQILGQQTAYNAADRNMLDVIGEDARSSNNNKNTNGDLDPDGSPAEDDSETNTTLALNSSNPNHYGPAGFTDVQVTPLGYMARVAAGLASPAWGAPPLAAQMSSALDSYYIKDSLPLKLPEDNPVLDESNDNPGGHVARSSDDGVAETSGGSYSAFGFTHYYGRNRNSSRDTDGISAGRSQLDDYMKRMFG